VTHKTETGETLIVELTPREAMEVRPQTAAKKAPAEPKSRGQLPDVQLAVERLYHADVKKLSPTEVQTVVGVVVAVLQAAGGGRHLQKIASDLELRGLPHVARVVRQHIQPSSGRHEPPLTTT
jgi:hypothetical protein